MALHDDLRILGLSIKERKILLALRDGADTPLKLTRQTGISRSAIYAILANLHKRGLAVSRIAKGRKRWQLHSGDTIDQALYDFKRFLLQIPEGNQQVHGRADSTVCIYRGKEAIRKVMLELFEANKNQRFFWGFQGDRATKSWNTLFTVSETNRINRDIKKGRTITEAVLPIGWLEEQARSLGIQWVKDFEGRTARVNVIDPKYFRHGGQCWIFKDSLYLFSLSEGLIVEVKNSEIQKMILSAFEFMQEHSQLIDANELLRDLMNSQVS